jgi:transcriptional regulator with XRE-family HTH domain
MKLNYTQEYVAQKMSMSQTTLSRIESDPNHPFTNDEITKFAKILKTTEDEIKKVSPYVSIHDNDIKGNGYVHHQTTNNGAEQIQQALSQLQQSLQLMTEMLQELKADKEFLREECRQLRQGDEKWMLILSDMQKQLVNFLSKK